MEQDHAAGFEEIDWEEAVGRVGKDGKVLLLVNGKAVERKLKLGPASSQGVRVEEGLIGGEDIILNPPADVKDGAKVERKK